jgi:RNA 3'-terminal phosphate cyclase (ATP)
MCGAHIGGAKIDSTNLTFTPGGVLRGGDYEWDIGTAGSTTLLAFTLLPLALFANGRTRLKISGGLFQDFAPSAHHMQHVLIPMLRRMGAEVDLSIIRPGYVPRGGGVIELRSSPVSGSLTGLNLGAHGAVTGVRGIALSSRLRKQRVSDRMAKECAGVLKESGLESRIEIEYDESAFQAGASLAIWAESDTGCLIGSDQAGKLGRRSESIGRYVARALIEDLATGATVDRHLADQVVIFAALASGRTEYIAPKVSEHVDTNLWLVGKWGAKARLEGRKLTIDGIGRQGLCPATEGR